MAHTYSTNVVHCVFSTKHRRDMIADQTKLWGYLSGVARHLKVPLLAIGGIANHVHLLISVPPTQNLAKIMCDLKANSSRWLNENGIPFAWQQGYAAFSVSPSRVAAAQEYIRHQAEHHKKRDFEQEFLDLLRRSGVTFDARDVFR
jgi:REP element-mobilizing transposase RayT